MVHKAFLAISLLSIGAIAGCDDDGGASTRDQYYGTDAAAGYTGPTPDAYSTTDAYSANPTDAAVATDAEQKADAEPAKGVNDLGVTTDIHDAASTD